MTDGALPSSSRPPSRDPPFLSARIAGATGTTACLVIPANAGTQLFPVIPAPSRDPPDPANGPKSLGTVDQQTHSQSRSDGAFCLTGIRQSTA